MGNIVPTGDNIVVKVDKIEERVMPSGIVLQEADRGRVVAVGTGMLTFGGTRVECEVKEGDRILFDPGMHVREVEVDGEQYAIMKEANVRAIL